MTSALVSLHESTARRTLKVLGPDKLTMFWFAGFFATCLSSLTTVRSSWHDWRRVEINLSNVM